LDEKSLDEFCSRCSTIVNCAGPVIVLQDRVAQSARRRHCHYVDLAGLSIVKERLLPHSPEIADLGLSFVISAGWNPGITELLPAYAYARAKSKMDAIESVSVYFSDCGEWSTNALRDAAWFLRRAGLSMQRFFRKGNSVRARMSEASRKVDLGDPLGAGRYSMFAAPELNELGRRLTDCDLLAYAYVSGLRNAVAGAMIALLPLSEKLGVRLLHNMFRRNRLPVGGFVVVHVLGHSRGRAAALRARIDFEVGYDYWMNGVVLATIARMVAARKSIRAGVHFLADAVDPMALMAELQEAGVRQTETFELSPTAEAVGKT
jgi:hypothetical protein